MKIDVNDTVEDKANSSFNVFPVNYKELSSLFNTEDISSGKSLKSLLAMGGPDSLIEKLRTNSKGGLNSEDKRDFIARENEFGRNELEPSNSSSVWQLMKDVLINDQMVFSLWLVSSIFMISGGVIYGFEGAIDGLVLIVAILIMSYVIAKNEFFKLKSYENHEKIKSIKYVNVIRNGQVEVIINQDILVGDILMLEPGDHIPADGICLRSNDMKVDESTYTGENAMVPKISAYESDVDGLKSENCFLLMESIVTSGSGVMLVLATGTRTHYHKSIYAIAINIPDPTPLQYKLQELSTKLGKYGLVACVFIFFGLLSHLFYDCYGRDVVYGATGFAYHIIHFILVSITVGIFAIPEGLPVIVTLGLAHRLENMANDKNLVMKLESCENAGIVTEVLVHPQGCLTANTGKVETLYIEDKILVSLKEEEMISITEGGMKLYSQAVSANTDANLKQLEGAIENSQNKIDCALLDVISKFGYDFSHFKNERIIKRIVPQGSDKKNISVYEIDEKCMRIFVRGNVKDLLQCCETILTAGGNNQPLDEQKKRSLYDSFIHPFGERGQLLIGFSYKDIQVDRMKVMDLPEAELTQNLTLICVAGIADPLRPETNQLIANCLQAGLSLRMISSDIKETALGISVKSGILQPEKADISNDNPFIMDGKTFRAKVGGLKIENSRYGQKVYKIANPYAFEELSTNLKVLYEAHAEDKLLLTIGLQNLGNTVALTGSGAADLLSLKSADVGYAMNLTGSDLLKNFAGIVVLDDSLDSIVRSIIWGRNLYDCIMKYIQFLMPCIISGVTILTIGCLAFGKTVISPAQLIWTYLVADTLSSIAFMTEQPDSFAIKKAPYHKTPDFISPRMKNNIVGQSVYQIIVLIVLTFIGEQFLHVQSSRVYGKWTVENGVHFTFVFNTFIYLQIFNQINSKLSHPYHSELSGKLFNNGNFLKTLVAIFGVQFMIVQLGGRLFYCSPLNAYQYTLSMIIGLGSLVVHLIVKLFPGSAIVPPQKVRIGDIVIPETEMTETNSYERPLPTSDDRKF